MFISILKGKFNYPDLEPSPYGLTGPIGLDFEYYTKLWTKSLLGSRAFRYI